MNEKVKQSDNWIQCFFNTSSFKINTYLETLSAEDIEYFRYLHFNTKNRIETKKY